MPLFVLFLGHSCDDRSALGNDCTFMSLFGRPAFRNLGRGVF